MAAAGAPRELIEEAEKKAAESSVFHVWPENWEVVEMFMRLQTQWHYSGMGQMTGLNYASVEALLRIYRKKKPRELLDDLQVMELAALRVVREQEKKG